MFRHDVFPWQQAEIQERRNVSWRAPDLFLLFAQSCRTWGDWLQLVLDRSHVDLIVCLRCVCDHSVSVMGSIPSLTPTAQNWSQNVLCVVSRSGNGASVSTLTFEEDNHCYGKLTFQLFSTPYQRFQRTVCKCPCEYRNFSSCSSWRHFPFL